MEKSFKSPLYLSGIGPEEVSSIKENDFGEVLSLKLQREKPYFTQVTLDTVVSSKSWDKFSGDLTWVSYQSEHTSQDNCSNPSISILKMR